MKGGEENYRRILGIRFFTGSAAEAVAIALGGGLVVVPSAPVLVNAMDDPATQAALLDSDFAITDSGLMILLWSLLRRERIPRVRLEGAVNQEYAEEANAIINGGGNDRIDYLRRHAQPKAGVTIFVESAALH